MVGTDKPTIATGDMLSPMGAANGAIVPSPTHIDESDPDDRAPSSRRRGLFSTGN
jgi:hypothetical protein